MCFLLASPPSLPSSFFFSFLLLPLFRATVNTEKQWSENVRSTQRFVGQVYLEIRTLKKSSNSSLLRVLVFNEAVGSEYFWEFLCNVGRKREGVREKLKREREEGCFRIKNETWYLFNICKNQILWHSQHMGLYTPLRDVKRVYVHCSSSLVKWKVSLGLEPRSSI